MIGSDAHQDHIDTRCACSDRWRSAVAIRGGVFLQHRLGLLADAAIVFSDAQVAPRGVPDRVGMDGMTLSGLQDHDAAIDALLSVARREMLLLAVAIGAIDDDGVAVSSARLRWAIGSARQLIVALGADPRIARRAHQLDRAANRAQRWLVTEPPQSLQAISSLVDRIAARRRRGTRAITAEHATLIDLDLDGLELSRILLHGAALTDVTAQRARLDGADASSTRWLRCELAGCSLMMAVFTGGALERCNLVRANLDGTSWHRAALSHCALPYARLTDARLDRAAFSDCDLRGACFDIVRSPDVASLAGARFERCDLRETSWAGRDLAGAVFTDCDLAGAHGVAPPMQS
jgi:uncharacterized protein YjbI with pentapeptide repeats